MVIEESKQKNKRLAKNTVFLYFRMLFNMFVSLYTSRVILNTLGVEDFGIYSVIAGVVTMFSFLNGSMAGATSRFITYELGLKSKNIKEVFSSAVTVHLSIAFVVLVLAETLGLWFFENKLVIPFEKMFSARWLYQMSIISAVATIIQVPYTATIIANEKMNVYAFVEIIHTILKLLIVYLLLFVGDDDKLITYGLLMCLISIIIACIYFVFCSTKYYYCKFRIFFNGLYLKPMLSFSGWDLYGNISVIARTQGVNMLLNIFYTAIMNAASGIATQVQSAVMNFATNVVLAFRPQIIKELANGNYQRVNTLIKSAALYTYLLLSVLSIPLILEMDTVLEIWLGIVPDYAVEFCRLTLVFNFFANFSSIILIGIHATGHNKRPSIVNGSLYLMVIPITYIAFVLGYEPWFPYLINILAIFIGVVLNSLTLRKLVNAFSLRDFYVEALGKGVLSSILSIFICLLIRNGIVNPIIRLVVVSIVTLGTVSVYTFFVCLQKNERRVFIAKIRKK